MSRNKIGVVIVRFSFPFSNFLGTLSARYFSQIFLASNTYNQTLYVRMLYFYHMTTFHMLLMLSTKFRLSPTPSVMFTLPSTLRLLEILSFVIFQSWVIAQLKCCFIEINDHLQPRGLFSFRSNNKTLTDCSHGRYEDLP